MIPLQENNVHIWSANLQITTEQEQAGFANLSEDEQQRANRFLSPEHRRRFIAARSTLRDILSFYLQIAPKEILFAYSEHHKPHLQFPANTDIQFNISHSHDLAVYAITLKHQIGIDIEKIENHYNPAVAARYLSHEESTFLNTLPEDQRAEGFYVFWSYKEALIKAVGKGLSLPLSSFTLSLTNTLQIISLNKETWQLIPLALFPGYASALASNQTIKNCYLCSIVEHKPQFSKLPI